MHIYIYIFIIIIIVIIIIIIKNAYIYIYIYTYYLHSITYRAAALAPRRCSIGSVPRHAVYVYMYVYMYIYTYVYVYVYVYIHIYVCVYIYIYMYIHTLCVISSLKNMILISPSRRRGTLKGVPTVKSPKRHSKVTLKSLLSHLNVIFSWRPF